MVYLDAIVVKVRTERIVVNRPVYIAMGVDVQGAKHVLGGWLGDGTEGAKFSPDGCAPSCATAGWPTSLPPAVTG